MSDDANGARTVYLVTSGEYSSLTFEAAFEDRDDAERTASRLSSSDYDSADVEELVLYPPGSSHVLYMHTQHHGTMVIAPGDARDGEIKSWISTSNQEGTDYPIRVIRSLGIHYVNGSARSEEALRKSLREKAAQVAALLAEGVDPLAVETFR